MGSLLKDGDQLTVNLYKQPRPITSNDLGKIVLFKENHEWVLHRVVKLNSRLVLKGDHSLAVDTFEDGEIWGELPIPSSSLLLGRLSALYTKSTPRFIRYFVRRLILALGEINRKITPLNTETQAFFSLLKNEKPHLTSNQLQSVETLAQQHFLAPYLYQKLNMKNQESLTHWNQTRKIESYKEAFVLLELEALREQLPEEISTTLLKGASLLKRVYKEPGTRFMSDVDLLVSSEDNALVETTLAEMGYQRITEDHGPANRCKSNWTKPMLDSEMVIDLHEKLNWFQPPEVTWKTSPSEIPGYQQLEAIDEIIYLSIHLTYSHNFQRLFWLVDLYELLKQNREKIDWQKFGRRARELNAEKAVTAVLIALRKTHDFQLPEYKKQKYPLLERLINRDFLLNPYGSMIRFLILKHLLQDKLSNAFKYDFYRLMIPVNHWLKRNR